MKLKFHKYHGEKLAYHYLSSHSQKSLVVCIHPLGMNQTVWKDISSDLSVYYDFLTLDLPGHGESPAIVNNLNGSISELVMLLLELTDSLGYSQFHFVGTSIGGAIGQELLLEHSKKLLSVMVTNTASKIGDELSWNNRAQSVRADGLAAMAGDIVLRWFGPEYLEKNREDVDCWQKSLGAVDNNSYAVLCEGLGQWEATCRFKDFKSSVPRCALAGEKDPAMPIENMKALSEQMKATVPLKVMPIGHVPSVEAPREFSNLLLEWLEHKK